MDQKTDAFDQMFGQMSSHVESIGELMDRFFSFLHRRTDFYVVDPSQSAKMGFAPGHAERIVLEMFRKYPHKFLDGMAQQVPHTSKETKCVSAALQLPQGEIDIKQAGARAKALARKLKKPKAASSALMKYSTLSRASDAAAPKHKSSVSALAEAAEIATHGTPHDTCVEGINEIWMTARGKQLPIGNGGAGPGYWWQQSLADVTINIPLSPDVRSSDVSVSVANGRIEIYGPAVTGLSNTASKPAASTSLASGDRGLLLSGKLGGEIEEEDILWVLEKQVSEIELPDIGATQTEFQERVASVLAGQVPVGGEAVGGDVLLKGAGSGPGVGSGPKSGAGSGSGSGSTGGSAGATGSGPPSPGDPSSDRFVPCRSYRTRCRVLQVTLSKSLETWWLALVEGHPEIDATRVDSSKHVSEYDAGTQSTIRRMMEDQSRKQRGLPSVQEEEAARVLERAKGLPGSPFLRDEGAAAEAEEGESLRLDYMPRYGTGGTISDPIPPAVGEGSAGKGEELGGST